MEVDLTKPLLAKFQLRRRVRKIVYEGLHLICFHCGQYGHRKEACPHIQHAANPEEVMHQKECGTTLEIGNGST
jgi:predicted metal-binding protein